MSDDERRRKGFFARAREAVDGFSVLALNPAFALWWFWNVPGIVDDMVSLRDNECIGKSIREIAEIKGVIPPIVKNTDPRNTWV